MGAYREGYFDIAKPSRVAVMAVLALFKRNQILIGNIGIDEIEMP
jgi:hypothetical protein